MTPKPHTGLKNRLLLLLGLVFAAQSANAQDIDTTTWNGWIDRGSSIATGVYARSGKANDYQIYSAVFFYDSANPVPGTSSGFVNGHKILAIGIRNNSGTTGSPSIKLDPNNNSYAPSPDGIVNGQASFSSNGDLGDSVMNTSSGNPQEITIRSANPYLSANDYYLPNGGNWGGPGQPGFRGINPGAGTWKVFIDLDQMTTEFGPGGTRTVLGKPTHGAFGGALTVAIGGLGGTEAVVQNINLLPPVHNVTQDTYFFTIQAAINAASAGNTIAIDPGTYVENITLDRRLTLDGAGDGSDPAVDTIITAAAAGTATLVYTAGGADVTTRQMLQNVRVTGASGGTGNNNSGILLSGGSMGFFTFDNVTATGNTGHGLVSNVAPAASTLADVVIRNSQFSGNGAYGIRTASHSVDGFSLTDCSIQNNASLGLGFNPSDNTTAQIGGVSLTNVIFSGNSSVADLYAFRMLGNMSLRNVDFLGSSGSGLFGLYLLGGYVSQTVAPAIGTVTLNDVTVSGTYTSAGISFLGYSNLANVSMTDVVLNTTVPTADRGHLRLSGVAGTLNLGNTAFNTATTPLDIRLNSNFGASGSMSTVAVDATSATFSGKTGATMTLAERFAQEDRIRHALDLTTDAPGLVTWIEDNHYVTTASGSIQRGIDAATAGNTVHVGPGTFAEDVNVTKQVSLQGSGHGVTTISGPLGGGGTTVQVLAANVEVTGFTVTRAGNNPTDWNNSVTPPNTAGIAVQTQSGALIHDNEITGNRSGIDINNCSGHTIRNNVITNNRTGLILRNQTDNLVVTENEITNNWTVGLAFLDASSGTNSPVQTAANCTFTNNDISGNWYGQIVDRQTGGALPAPGSNLKNFEMNWLGTTSPVVTTANSAEPGYAAQIPVAFGGSATAPGGQPTILGAASANVDINPFLASGTDTNVETTPGRGLFGFQGDTGTVIEGIFNDITISSPQTYIDLYIAPGTTVNVTPNGSLAVEDLDLGAGATLEVNGGELDLGDGSVISGTFTIFNSFGSWDINGNVTFTIGQSLALISEIHVAAGKTLTVNGGGKLILDGCSIDSQTPGSKYNIAVATNGLLTVARTVVTDANIDINSTAALPLRSQIYDSSFVNSDIEAGVGSRVYHNLFDAATNLAANTDATSAFDAVDAWANVTNIGDLKNRYALTYATPGDVSRTLDSAGNLFVQPTDPVVVKLGIGSLDGHTVTGAEALLGYSSDFLVLQSTTPAVAEATGWDVIIDDDAITGSLGTVDSALGLELVGPGNDGVTGPADLASVSFNVKPGVQGQTANFFRVQTNGSYIPATTDFMKDTRLTKSVSGVPSYLAAFTENTGDLIVDDQDPAITAPASSGTQVQPTYGTVNVLDPSNYVIRDGTPVILTFSAADLGLAGLDAADATADLALTATNGTTSLAYTVAAVEAPLTGVVTYTVTITIPTAATVGTYPVTATVRDRSGNVSALAALGSFQIDNEVLATVELQSFVGGTRSVLFTATNGAGDYLASWTKNVVFAGPTGTVPLTAVPVGTAAISAKTAWNLRSKLAVSFSTEGVGAVSLTGTDRLPGGDLNGDNVVNTLDYSILRYNYTTTNPVANINGDAVVNLTDYLIQKGNFYTAGDAE